MAEFKLELPKEIMDDIKKIYDNSEEIFGGMTRAGAEVVEKNVKANAPLPELASHVKTSVTYKTPSDDGINTKVYVGGHLPFSGNRTSMVRPAGGKRYVTYKGVPAGFVAAMYEYGTSNRYTDSGAYRGVMGKRPFFRKSFKKAQIEKAMLKAQKELSGGLLDE